MKTHFTSSFILLLLIQTLFLFPADIKFSSLVPNMYHLYNFTVNRVENLHDILIIDNYTLFCNINYINRILISKNISDTGGNPFSYDSLVNQHVVFQKITHANIARWGISQYGLAYKPINYHFPFVFNEVKTHSLLSYQKIVVGFSYHEEFGHFLQDMICGIVAMPSEILKDAEIFVRFKSEKSIKQYIEMIGLDPSKAHKLPDEWIYAQEIYMCVGNFGINSLHVSWMEIRKLIYQKLDISFEPPHLHTFLNKEKGLWGYISNMQQISAYCIQTFPEYEWNYPPIYILKSLEIVVKIMFATKLLITASGSLAFNDLFMQKNSCVLILGPLVRDNPAFCTAYAIGLWMFAASSPNITQGVNGTDGGIFPMDDFKKILPVVIDTAYNQTQSNETQDYFKPYLNITTFYQKHIQLFKDKTNIMRVRLPQSLNTTILESNKEVIKLSNEFP